MTSGVNTLEQHNGWHAFLLATGFKESSTEAENDQATFNKLTNKKLTPAQLATFPEDKQDLWLSEAGIMCFDDRGAILIALRQCGQKKKRKHDEDEVALHELHKEFEKALPTHYFIEGTPDLEEELAKMATVAVPLVDPKLVLKEQRDCVPWLEVSYPCKTYQHKTLCTRFLSDLSGDDLPGQFLAAIEESNQRDTVSIQGNKLVVLAAPLGAGKTALAFLAASRSQYVLLLDVSVEDHIFAVVKNLARVYCKILNKVISTYPSSEFVLREYFTEVISRAIKLSIIVYLAVLPGFHKVYKSVPQRGELLMRFLSNGGLRFPLANMKQHMPRILQDSSSDNSIHTLYTSVTTDLGQAGILPENILVFVDELPSLKSEKALEGAFIRKSHHCVTSNLDREKALKDIRERPTSLLYLTRQTLLELVVSTEYPLRVVSAGTDVEVAIQSEGLPSPYTRDNILAFTQLLHLTPELIWQHMVRKISTNLRRPSIDAISWRWIGRPYWYTEYFLTTLWTKYGTALTVESAVILASKEAFPVAVERASRIVQGHMSKVVNISNGQTVQFSTLIKMVYYKMMMCGGTVSLPDHTLWKLIDLGIVHVTDALGVPNLSTSLTEEAITASETELKVTIAEPIMQFGIQKALETDERFKKNDAVLSYMHEVLFNTFQMLGKKLSYHGNFAEHAFARNLQLKAKANEKKPISMINGFEILRRTVFEYYSLSVAGFSKPKQLKLRDVDAMTNSNTRHGFFPSTYAGPDIKLVCKKMDTEELKKAHIFINTERFNVCPKTAFLMVQAKCRNSAASEDTLHSLNPELFYAVRKTRSDDSIELNEIPGGKEFSEWLAGNAGAFDVYLRIIYSHSGFGDRFATKHREYMKSPIARYRPILLLDSDSIDSANKEIFNGICGKLAKPLKSHLTPEALEAMKASLEEGLTGVQAKKNLKDLGLFFSVGSAQEAKDHLRNWLNWKNDFQDLNISIPFSKHFQALIENDKKQDV